MKIPRMSGVANAPSLSAQIHERQRIIGIRAALVENQLAQQMTTPTSLVMMGGIGFILAELSQTSPCKPCVVAGKPQAPQVSPLKFTLNLLISLQTVYMALPASWKTWLFNEMGKRQTDKN
jgi:hypothetical protein